MRKVNRGPSLRATNIRFLRSPPQQRSKPARRENVMCFSAPASFGVASVLGLAGAAAIGKVSERREIPLASIPLVFASQQAIEGALWLALGNEGLSRWALPLANAFMVMALVVWPVWPPIAAILVERERRRRLAMIVILLVGIPLAARGAIGMSTQLYEACVVQNSIAYSNGLPYLPRQFAGYVLCACFPFLLSSYSTLRWFGAIVLAGLILSAALYTYAYVSVWCFFAAAGSVMIYLHFARTQKKWRGRSKPNVSHIQSPANTVTGSE
jgi:hypothetical protein